jgi:hypothetical protein
MPSFYDVITDGAPLFITAIPAPTRWMSAKCVSDVEAFVRRHDEPGIASYFAVARLKEGAQARLAETVKETQWLWADVDFKDRPDLAPEGVDKCARVRRPCCANPPVLRAFWPSQRRRSPLPPRVSERTGTCPSGQ